MSQFLSKFGFVAGFGLTIAVVAGVAVMMPSGSGGGGGSAKAATPFTNIKVEPPHLAVSGFSQGGVLAFRGIGGHQTVTPVPVGSIDPVDLLHFSSLEPHLVQSFPVLFS